MLGSLRQEMLHKALDVPFPVVDIWYYLISVYDLSWVYMFVTCFFMQLLYRKALLCFSARVNDYFFLCWSLAWKLNWLIILSKGFKLLNVDVVVEGLDCCFYFSGNHKTHIVVCKSHGLHEWITQNWNVNCTTLILPQVLTTSQKRKKKKSTFNFAFQYLFIFRHFVQWLFCMLGLQTYKCCLLLPWRTTEINVTVMEEQCERHCCFFCVFVGL